MKLIEQLKRDEGLSLELYTCTSGKFTIGYGRNLEDKGISKAEAESMLTNDVEAIKVAMFKLCEAYESLLLRGEGIRADVLVNMAFNMGVHGLLNFKRTLKYIEFMEYKKASVEMLNSRWAKQVGDRANRLAKQMETGEYQ
ncbi:MAG: glycoside hydrolase [Gammaproteobacteria bacterium]|nr:glycoside hydrolase [Bacteroidota bacterium]MCP4488163.1 glycoside hydrolase [Gammaproteobacteria bacterium]